VTVQPFFFCGKAISTGRIDFFSISVGFRAGAFLWSILAHDLGNRRRPFGHFTSSLVLVLVRGTGLWIFSSARRRLVPKLSVSEVSLLVRGFGDRLHHHVFFSKTACEHSGQAPLLRTWATQQIGLRFSPPAGPLSFFRCPGNGRVFPCSAAQLRPSREFRFTSRNVIYSVIPAFFFLFFFCWIGAAFKRSVLLPGVENW